MIGKYTRTSLRAPLHTSCLYEDDGYVFKGRIRNISRGGILMGQLPHMPDINLLPLMIKLPRFPLFESVIDYGVDYEIIRVRARIVRSFEEQSQVDQIFIPFIGCEFAPMPDDVSESINDYVERFAKNLIYLLSLFGRKRSVDDVRFLSGLLGYDSELHLPLLRQKILHDYQSLESL